MYSMPLLSPLPMVPPCSRLDSADILHIGHCANRSESPVKHTSVRIIKTKATFFFMALNYRLLTSMPNLPSLFRSIKNNKKRSLHLCEATGHNFYNSAQTQRKTSKILTYYLLIKYLLITIIKTVFILKS